MSETDPKPILITITANFILEIPRLQEKELISRKEELNEKIREWLKREAAIKGWTLKKLWHYYKVEYRSITGYTDGTITTHIQPRLKGRGGRKSKKQ